MYVGLAGEFRQVQFHWCGFKKALNFIQVVAVLVKLMEPCKPLVIAVINGCPLKLPQGINGAAVFEDLRQRKPLGGQQHHHHCAVRERITHQRAQLGIGKGQFEFVADHEVGIHRVAIAIKRLALGRTFGEFFFPGIFQIQRAGNAGQGERAEGNFGREQPFGLF